MYRSDSSISTVSDAWELLSHFYLCWSLKIRGRQQTLIFNSGSSPFLAALQPVALHKDELSWCTWCTLGAHTAVVWPWVRCVSSNRSHGPPPAVARSILLRIQLCPCWGTRVSSCTMPYQFPGPEAVLTLHGLTRVKNTHRLFYKQKNQKSSAKILYWEREEGGKKK